MMTEASPKKLRYGLIGVGANVYGMHHPGLELDTVDIVGICDLREDVNQRVQAEWEAPSFTDYKQMIDETKPDVVVVMTPHPWHAPMAIYAMEAGAHVLVEKPMADEVALAYDMIATAERTGKVLAVNFQQRLRPEIIAAKNLIDSGGLGKIQHVDIKITWTRTALYYSQVDWRGTWSGEGGAVLMNQAPHELDLLCHLIGKPARVFCFARTTVHDIDCEDTIQAVVEWDHGALGTLHISTAEAGQPQRFEIIGTNGHLAISHGGLSLKQFDVPVDEFIRTSDQAFAAPKLADADIAIGDGKGDHRSIHQNLYDHIIHGAPLAAPGTNGVYGLELANAMTFSSYTNRPVEFPLDHEAYSRLLANLRAGRQPLEGV